MTVAEAHGGPIHLLLSDVMMPELNGPGLAEQLRAVRPGFLVILMLAEWEDSVDTNQIITALANEYWQHRGCPIGSPESDWFKAEEEVKIWLQVEKEKNSEGDPNREGGVIAIG
jgi:Protein of unknown function (DUF2934)